MFFGLGGILATRAWRGAATPDMAHHVDDGAVRCVLEAIDRTARFIHD